MTTPNPNLSELRRLAEGAGPGRWQANGETVEYAAAPGIPIFLADPEGMYVESIGKAWCEFAAAANPATILALLDMVENQQRRLDRWEPKIGNGQTITSSALQSNERGA